MTIYFYDNIFHSYANERGFETFFGMIRAITGLARTMLPRRLATIRR